MLPENSLTRYELLVLSKATLGNITLNMNSHCSSSKTKQKKALSPHVQSFRFSKSNPVLIVKPTTGFKVRLFLS